MKVMWVGNQHDQPTGYGTIAKNVIQHVQHNSQHQMVEFAVSGVQRVRPYEWEGVKVYSQSTYGGKMGLGDWASVDAIEKPDVWMLNFDAWATADASGHSVIPKIGIKYALYPPVDHDPLPPPWYDVMRNAVDIVPYCDFGARVIREGVGPTVHISKPIHHGIDTSVFKPLDVKKADVFGHDTDEDAFVVGIFKNNQGTRAKYELQLEACRMFLDTVQDDRVRFFIMAHATGSQSPNLVELVNRFGLSGKVFIIGASQYKSGLTAEEIAPYYNACDVVLNCVAGEGYGLPVVEAFGCGTPVIGTAFTSMPELILGREGEIKKKIYGNGECYEGARGWVVPTSGKEYTALKRSDRRIFLPQDAAAALVQAYSGKDKLTQMGINGNEWAQRLDWKTIGDQWIAQFDAMESLVKPKVYSWKPLQQDEEGKVGGNKTACVVFSWNRPNYLVKTLDSLAHNTRADECDWFFYQDGWQNEEGQFPYCNDETEVAVQAKVQNCVEILTDFPFKYKEIIAKQANVCIGRQLQEAKAKLFGMGYEHVIFFDDDHVVSEDYIDVLLKLHEQYPDAIVGAQASEIRNIPSYSKLDMVGVTTKSQGDGKAKAGRWRWLAYLLPKSVHDATVEEMDGYMDFTGLSYRNIPHHAVRQRYGCEITGFDGVMDVICNQHEIKRIATVIPRGRYIGESGLFGTPKVFAAMGFPTEDVFKFDESSYERFVTPEDAAADRTVEAHGDQLIPDSRGQLEGKDDWVEKAITDGVHEGDVVVDMGACIGYYTTLMSRLVGPSGIVYAFEPDPDNFSTLQKNTSKMANVVCVNAAVGANEGKAQLSLAPLNRGNNCIGYTGSDRHAIEVDMVSLDGYFKAKEISYPINFMKIDVEGVEGDAIRGAMRTINRSKDLAVCTEYSPKRMEEYGMTRKEFIDVMGKTGMVLVADRYGDASNKKLLDGYKETISFTDLIYRKAE